MKNKRKIWRIYLSALVSECYQAYEHEDVVLGQAKSIVRLGKPLSMYELVGCGWTRGSEQSAESRV